MILLALAAAGAAGEGGFNPVVVGEVLHADALEFWNLSFSDVVTYPKVAEGRLDFLQLEAKACGGRVQGRVSVTLDGGGLDLDLQILDCRLEQVVRGFAGADPGFTGILNGSLRLSLQGGDWTTANGSGAATIVEGNLVSVPMLAQFLLGQPLAPTGKDRARMRFAIERGRVSFRDFLVEAPSVRADLRGQIAADWSLRLRVTPFPSASLIRWIDGIGDPLADLFGGFMGRASRFYIRGHITAPTFHYRPF